MVTFEFGKDFAQELNTRWIHHLAYTLSPGEIGEHDDGWVITGQVHEDWYEWVNEFEAIHPVFGRVWGDFESVVYADSKDGFDHFFEHHTPQEWDYWDI